MSRSLRRLLGLALSILLLTSFLGSLAAQPPQPSSPDTVLNPYRNFIGSWVGSAPINPDKMAMPIQLTVVEEKDKARMRWHYVFGRKGDKGYQEADKYILMSPKDGKMLMNFDGSPVLLYDAPDLAAFTQAGIGTLSCVYRYTYRNYWHLEKAADQRVTLDLQPGTLSYLWETTRDGATKVYSRLEFTRVSAAPGTKE
jgi:hypothetical protein